MRIKARGFFFLLFLSLFEYPWTGQYDFYEWDKPSNAIYTVTLSAVTLVMQDALRMVHPHLSEQPPSELSVFGLHRTGGPCLYVCTYWHIYKASISISYMTPSPSYARDPWPSQNRRPPNPTWTSR